MATLTAQLQESAFSKVLACLVLGGYTLVSFGANQQLWSAAATLYLNPGPLDFPVLVTSCHAHQDLQLQDKERLMLELRELLVISEQQYIGIRGEIEAQRRCGTHLQLGWTSPYKLLQPSSKHDCAGVAL